MEYVLKLKAKFNCEIIINSSNYFLKNNDEISFNLSLNHNEKFNIEVLSNEISENVQSLNYNIEIIESNKELKIYSNNVKIYVIKNQYLIELYNNIILKDINILHSSNSFLIYNTIKTHIVTRNDNITLPNYFNFVENKKIGNISSFEFTNNEKKYLTLLNNSTVLFSDYFNEIKIEKNNIKILSNINDIAKHGKLTLIDTTNFNKTEEIVYTQNEPKLVKNKKLIALAFLQALKVDNIKLMKFYLNDSLKEIGTLQNYKDFFGNYKKSTFSFENNIEANLFYPSNNPNIFYGKTFTFNILNNKIDKITQNNL